MGLGKTEKQSYESYFIHGDFSPMMTSPETISTIASLVVLDNAGEDATDELIESGSPIIGTDDDVFKVFFRIQNGDSTLSPYKFTVKIETDTGNKWEIDGLIRIKES